MYVCECFVSVFLVIGDEAVRLRNVADRSGNLDRQAGWELDSPGKVGG